MTLAASGSRVRLSVFEENRRQPRCTGSHPERMRPHQWPLLDMTPLVLRALIGSSRVREDLPRLVREVGPSCASSANRSLAPTDTHLVRRSRSMRCGRGKRDLGSPQAAAPSVRFHPTPRIAIDQSGFSSREHDSSHREPTVWLANPSDSLCGVGTCSSSSRAGAVTPAGPRSPIDLATLAPARGPLAAPRNLGADRYRSGFGTT